MIHSEKKNLPPETIISIDKLGPSKNFPENIRFFLGPSSTYSTGHEDVTKYWGIFYSKSTRF